MDLGQPDETPEAASETDGGAGLPSATGRPGPRKQLASNAREAFEQAFIATASVSAATLLATAVAVAVVLQWSGRVALAAPVSEKSTAGFAVAA